MLVTLWESEPNSSAATSFINIDLDCINDTVSYANEIDLSDWDLEHGYHDFRILKYFAVL